MISTLRLTLFPQEELSFTTSAHFECKSQRALEKLSVSQVKGRVPQVNIDEEQVKRRRLQVSNK